MSFPLSRRPIAVLSVLLALASLSVAALAVAESGPAARTSAKCGSVKTRDGGRAEFVNTVRARCKTGRRVARKANGRRYRALGFRCKPKRKRNLSGKLYGCGRFKNGRGQGIGFIYTAPR